MKEIKLTQGQIALVDEDDYEKLSKYKWAAAYDKKRNIFYAARGININKKIKTIRMHEEIMGTIGKDKKLYCVDHIDHNTLNNQKNNLRICDIAGNMQNRRIPKSNTSGYKGVCRFYHDKNKFIAQIGHHGKYFRIGKYNTALEAAKAYNEKALELYGEFAFLNKING